MSDTVMNAAERLQRGLAVILISIALLTAFRASAQTNDAAPETDVPSKSTPVVTKTVALHVSVLGGVPASPLAHALVLVTPRPLAVSQQKTRTTDEKGIAAFGNLPEGTYFVQVVADGWIVYGRDHQLSTANESLELVLTKQKQ